MESVIQIHSFSHGEFRRLHIPNSFEFKPGLSLIECKKSSITNDLGILLKINFNPENVEKENRMRISMGIHEHNTANSNIEFSTQSKEYLLKRIFWKDQTSELSLTDLKTNEIVFDDEAGAILKNIKSPILLAPLGNYWGGASIIYFGNNQLSRNKMANMVTTWTKSLGYVIPKIEIDEYGNWYSNESWGSRRSYAGTKGWNNVVRLLKNLAQAVMRKDAKGSCPPLFIDFIHHLNYFELISVLDLVKGICRENQIQFIISMTEVPTTESNIHHISDYS
jgi:hypothetical protein